MFPTISQYAMALEELVAEKSVSERKDLVERFVQFLEQRREKRKLPQILRRLEEFADDQTGRKKITAVTAHDITDTLAKNLKRKAEELFPGKKIDLHFEVDQAVIGGVVFKTKEEMYDMTLATALKKLKKEISR